MKNYYDILGISSDASIEDIKRAYKILAHQFHPDKEYGNEKRFKEINEAYRILSYNDSRAEYDKHFNCPNQNDHLSSEHHYEETIAKSPNPSKPEKIYEASKKIKSSKWNAFFLTDSEVEEYLADGIYIEDGGFFSKFSKKRRDDNARRTKRTNLLVSQRIVNISNEYIKRNTIPLEKEIISEIIEPTNNIFNRKVSHIWKSSFGDMESLRNSLQKLVEDGKMESGEIIACFPILGGWSDDVLFFTTNGICRIVVPEGNGHLSLTLASGQALGPIGFVTGHLASTLIHKHKMNKSQQKLIELATAYSPSLLSQCFPGSYYTPYEMINIFTYFYDANDPASSIASIIYANNQQKFHKFSRDNMSEIINILAANNPPKAN